jgi:glycosyltransferase involved in cell wall biosynthesis
VLFTKFAFSFVDFFIVQSKVVEKDLLGMFPNVNYSFTPHPVYEIFGEPISKEFARNLLRLAQGKYILFFGYIRKYKGLSILIDAMKYLSDLKDLKLLVVGEFYEDEEKYRTQVEEEKLGERVIFYSDYVPNEEVVKFFCASDVVVLPYLSATQSGIVQIAYQFGKPVISTNVGGLAEVLIDGKTGFIVPPNNSVALADAIRNFYDEGKGDDFSRNALEEKKKYTWMALVEAIERFIEK